ncbi:hypothetical protein SRHO_G00080200 [Serrasalmus rhombeus]
MTGGRRDKEGPLVFGCICFIACYSETDRCFLQGPSHRPAAYSALLFHTKSVKILHLFAAAFHTCLFNAPLSSCIWLRYTFICKDPAVATLLRGQASHPPVVTLQRFLLEVRHTESSSTSLRFSQPSRVSSSVSKQATESCTGEPPTGTPDCSFFLATQILSHR